MKKKKKIIKRTKVNKTEIFHLYKIFPFGTQIVFFYSDNGKNITKYLNKKKNQDISKWLYKEIGEFNIGSEKEDGSLTYNEVTYKPLVLFIKKRKELDWYLWDTLIHEITHLVQHLEKYFGFEDEQEFRAWITEAIFRDIRRIIYEKQKK